MSVQTVVISPDLAKRSIPENLRELWLYRGLIWTMIERDLRVRYKGSVLGIIWSMIVPIMQAFMYTLVLGFILGAGPKNQSSYIFCALIPWMFFQTAIMDSSQSILSQLGLIRKIYFPREIPVIAATGASLIHLVISITVFVIYRWLLMPVLLGLFGHGGWPGPPSAAIVYLPFVLVTLAILTAGLSLIVAALNVFYEDIKFMVNIAMQFLMYMTPIMYFAENMRYASRIPAALRSPLYHVYLANPIAWIVGAFKQMFFPRTLVPVPGMSHLVLTAPFDIRYGLIAFFTSVAICMVGYRVFTNLKWKFAERP